MSILQDVKLQCGISPEYTHFDTVLIMHINTALMTLNQLGVGVTGFLVTSTEDDWDDFLGGFTDVGAVKTYVGSKVRMLFDPPQASAHANALEKNITELEWRLNVAVDPSQLGE